MSSIHTITMKARVQPINLVEPIYLSMKKTLYKTISRNCSQNSVCWTCFGKVEHLTNVLLFMFTFLKNGTNEGILAQNPT